jgi:hypothetical protein
VARVRVKRCGRSLDSTALCSEALMLARRRGKKRLSLTQEEAEELYVRQALSMREIARQRQVHIDSLRLELVALGLTIRSQTQKPNEFHYDPTGNEVLEALAIGIWLGEGTKEGKRIEVTNCDPSILKTWTTFLLKVCHVDGSKLRLVVELHDAGLTEASRRFWQAALGFNIPCCFVLRGSRKGKAKRPMGTARVRFNSKFLQQRVRQRAVELTSALM